MSVLIFYAKTYLTSEVVEVGGVGGLLLKPFLCQRPLFCLECSIVSSGSVTASRSTFSESSVVVGCNSRLVCFGSLGRLGIAPRLTLFSASRLLVTHFGLLGGSGSSLFLKQKISLFRYSIRTLQLSNN